jgi:hypothetical protein
MKMGAIIIGLLLASDLSLSASAASTTPMIQQVATMPNEHDPPAEICSEKDSDRLSDWGDQRDSPCRPCVSDESITKAYPISEVRPYCQ